MRPLTKDEIAQARGGSIRRVVREDTCLSCPSCRAALDPDRDAEARGYGNVMAVYDDEDTWERKDDLATKLDPAMRGALKFVGGAGPVVLFQCHRCHTQSVYILDSERDPRPQRRRPHHWSFW